MAAAARAISSRCRHRCSLRHRLPRRHGYLSEPPPYSRRHPITSAEALTQNFDHYNTFTEYTMRQVLEYSGFDQVKVLPLRPYVFWKNPLNYVLMALSALYTLFFRGSFIMYGKKNRLFTKKIDAVCPPWS